MTRLMKIEIKDIYKKYRGQQVLKGASLEAESGSCIGILGANGCGKTTLLSILAGIQPPDSGSFLCDGEELFARHKLRRKLVGYVPQGTPLMEELTAKDNLLLWYAPTRLKQELEKGILSRLGIGEFIKKPVHKLSGGMKKRLAIGCSVAEHPPILLLDEPTAALDLPCQQLIADYLQEYRKAGGILLLVTHDPRELALCDRLFILKDGILHPYTFDGDLQSLAERL